MSRNYDRNAAQASIDLIKRLATEHQGNAPVWAVRAAAEKLGVKERAVWRWLKEGVPGPVGASLD